LSFELPDFERSLLVFAAAIPLGEQVCLCCSLGQLDAENLVNFVQLRQIVLPAKISMKKFWVFCKLTTKSDCDCELAPAAVVGTRHTATRTRITIEKSATVTEKEH